FLATAHCCEQSSQNGQNLHSFTAKDGQGTASVVPNSAPAERKELSRGGAKRTPGYIGITIRTPAGVAGRPRALPLPGRVGQVVTVLGVRKKRSPLAKFLPLLRSSPHD